MATVDLDKLSAELTAAGWYKIGESFMDTAFEFGRFKAGVNVDGHTVFLSEGFGETTSEQLWVGLDIIRRHVAPVAPDPGLREAIANAIHERNWAEGIVTDGDLADAVLAVLAERGVR